MQHKFRGLGVAVVTPFKADKSVDEVALIKIIHYLIDGGADYLVALGTTGESATLSLAEKKRIIEIFVSECKNKIMLVVGVGGNNTSAIIEQLKNLKNYAIDGILSVSPYYNKPSQRAIIEHYKAIASTTDLPIILYNVPARTASNIEAATTLQLAHNHQNIVAIKEASGNLQQMMDIIKGKPPGFALISGDDALIIPTMSIGGEGLISVAGNAYPAIYKKIINYLNDNNYAAANELFYQQLLVLKSMFEEGNPTGVKYVMHQLGLCENILRLPLIPASRQLEKQIAGQHKEISKLQPSLSKQ